MREAIFFGVLILAGVLWLFFPLLRATYNDYRAKQMIYEMERPYREDAYGGVTPEATYALFIAALKQGDIDLASKYFSPKRQAEWLKNLQQISKEKKLPSMIEDLRRMKPKGSLAKNVFQFDLVNENAEVILLMTLAQNTFTHKWKIESL